MSDSPPAFAIPNEHPRPRLREVFIGAMVLVAVVVTIVVYLVVGERPHLGFLGISLAVAAAIGARTNVRLNASIVVGGIYIPLVAASVLDPVLSPILAVAFALAPAPSASLRVLNTGYFVASTGAAAIAGHLAATHVNEIGTTAVAGLTFLTVNGAACGLYERLVWREPLRALIGPIVASFVATGAIAVPITSMIVWGNSSIGSIVVPSLLLPLAMTSYFHSLYHRKVQLTDELAEKAQILAKTNLQFAAAMVRALDQRDAYTAGHSAAVAVYTRDIAREMGMDDEGIRVAHLAGLLHDIGKIGVPGRVLNKTAPLDDEEYELMKTHAAMGAEILGEVDLYSEIAILVRSHHERVDGRGYPDNLEGEMIPAISRIISVADTYSAMTTDRPYREGMPTEKAMSILRECRGTQLDTDFTDAFLRILIIADEAYQRGKQTDFEVEVAKHQALSQVEAEAIRVNAPTPAGPTPVVQPMLPAANEDGEEIAVPLEREAA